MTSRRTVVACLWDGTDLHTKPGTYSPMDVLRLWHGVRRHITGGELIVLADEHYAPMLDEMKHNLGRPYAEVPEEQTDELLHTFHISNLGGWGERHGGWTHVLEAFADSFLVGYDIGRGQRVLLVGLDTVFVRNSDWLFDWDASPVGLPADPYNLEGPPCDAVVTFNAEGARVVWNHFRECHESSAPFRHLYGGRPSEMVLLQHLFEREGWRRIEGTKMERLVSYKGGNVALKGVPEEATLVYFHGSPKPQDLGINDPMQQYMDI